MKIEAVKNIKATSAELREALALAGAEQARLWVKAK
jgi:hypothetical protein